MTKNSILIDLDDPRTAKIADAISNKTSKKILSLLAEQELSETELSKSAGIPLNTIGYNIKKLEESGLIEKTGKFLYSVKGKRIHKYRISNKRIVISPKSMIKGILPTVLISSLIALWIKIFIGDISSPAGTFQAVDTAQVSSAELIEKTAEGVSGVQEIERIVEPQLTEIIPAIASSSNAWAWFLLGALVAILIIVILNWRKK